MPYDERDEKTNRFVPSYSDEDFLQVVSDLDLAGTGDVAEEIGCSRENARLRLNELADRGELEKTKVGNQNVYRQVE